MKAFWALIALLVLLAGGYFAVGAMGQMRAEAARSRAMAELEMAKAEQNAVRATAEAERAATQPNIIDAPPKADLVPEPSKPAAAAQTEPAEPVSTPDPVLGALEMVIESDLKPAPADTTDAKTAEVPASATAAAAPTTPATDAPAPAISTTGFKIEGVTVTPSKIEKKDDGSMLADDKFVIKGAGTQAQPYRVTWEMLATAEGTFDPRNKKRNVPEYIGMLHDKWVTVTGYVSFPLQVKEPRDLLAMLNQWDGCCIGVPPTPYDAIEVMLKKPITGEDVFAVAGGVTGKFQLKPYVVGDWLVGLYVMEEGSLKVMEYGAGSQNGGQ